MGEPGEQRDLLLRVFSFLRLHLNEGNFFDDDFFSRLSVLAENGAAETSFSDLPNSLVSIHSRGFVIERVMMMVMVVVMMVMRG